MGRKMWIDYLQRGSDIFQFCLDSVRYLLHTHAIQGTSGGNKVDPSLQHNVEILYTWIEYIYHVGSSHDCNSLVKPGLMAEGKNTKEEGQIVFVTAVDLVSEPHKDELHGLTETRQVPHSD